MTNLEQRSLETGQIAMLSVGLFCRVLEPENLVARHLQVCP